MDVRQASVILLERYLSIADAMPPQADCPPCTDAQHLSWMCSTAIANAAAWPEDKLSRWLGFVQGILTVRGYLTVEGERQASRPLFHEAYRTSGTLAPASMAPPHQ